MLLEIWVMMLLYLTDTDIFLYQFSAQNVHMLQYRPGQTLVLHRLLRIFCRNIGTVQCIVCALASDIWRSYLFQLKNTGPSDLINTWYINCVFKFFFPTRNLAAIQDREICCYSISCKEKDNIGKMVYCSIIATTKEHRQDDWRNFLRISWINCRKTHALISYPFYWLRVRICRHTLYTSWEKFNKPQPQSLTTELNISL